jgi:hypothetical protein
MHQHEGGKRGRGKYELIDDGQGGLFMVGGKGAGDRKRTAKQSIA